MKKIINGKKYDTNTAELVGEYWNGLGTNDFCYLNEELYRKRTTGEFFLYGSGGPKSKYAEFIGNGSISGSTDLYPLTINEAMSWAEKHLECDLFEKIFGVVSE